jgi:hypothetical protein
MRFGQQRVEPPSMRKTLCSSFHHQIAIGTYIMWLQKGNLFLTRIFTQLLLFFFAKSKFTLKIDRLEEKYAGNQWLTTSLSNCSFNFSSSILKIKSGSCSFELADPGWVCLSRSRVKQDKARSTQSSIYSIWKIWDNPFGKWYTNVFGMTTEGMMECDCELSRLIRQVHKQVNSKQTTADCW